MRRLLLAAVAVAGVVAGVVVSFNLGGGELDELPLADGGGGGRTSPDSLFMVELGRPPDYRLVESTFGSTESEVVYSFPEQAAIYDMAVNPTGGPMAMSYTVDIATQGTGIYLLGTDVPVEQRQPQPLGAEVPLFFHDGLVFSDDGATLWGFRTSEPRSDVFAVDVATGDTVLELPQAAFPAPLDDGFAYLGVEADGARRWIGLADDGGAPVERIDVLDGAYDLGHLIADRANNRLLFTALIPPDEQGVLIGGAPAGAHGAHDGPAQWLTMDLDDREVRRLLDHDPMGVRDATLLSDGNMVATTTAGVLKFRQQVEAATAGPIIVLVAH